MFPSNFFEHHTRIAVDIDETLAETFLLALEYAHSTGRLLAWKNFDDIVTHDFFMDPQTNMTKEDTLLLWDELWLSAPVTPEKAVLVPYAEIWMNQLHALWKELFLITARDEMVPEKRRGTIAWSEKYFPYIPEDHVFFANHMTQMEVTKSSFMKVHDITLLIDDNIKNAYDAVENGIACILVEKPWNRHDTYKHPLLQRVKSWKDIIS